MDPCKMAPGAPTLGNPGGCDSPQGPIAELEHVLIILKKQNM